MAWLAIRQPEPRQPFGHSMEGDEESLLTLAGFQRAFIYSRRMLRIRYHVFFIRYAVFVSIYFVVL